MLVWGAWGSNPRCWGEMAQPALARALARLVKWWEEATDRAIVHAVVKRNEPAPEASFTALNEAVTAGDGLAHEGQHVAREHREGACKPKI